MSVNLKKNKFAPAGVQAGSSSRTFHPEATGVGGKVQSKKLYRLKRKLLHLHPVYYMISKNKAETFTKLTFLGMFSLQSTSYPKWWHFASNIEQVLVATPNKAPTIRPPASHHENYPG